MFCSSHSVEKVKWNIHFIYEERAFFRSLHTQIVYTEIWVMAKEKTVTQK